MTSNYVKLFTTKYDEIAFTVLITHTVSKPNMLTLLLLDLLSFNVAEAFIQFERTTKARNQEVGSCSNSPVTWSSCPHSDLNNINIYYMKWYFCQQGLYLTTVSFWDAGGVSLVSGGPVMFRFCSVIPCWSMMHSRCSHH